MRNIQRWYEVAVHKREAPRLPALIADDIPGGFSCVTDITSQPRSLSSWLQQPTFCYLSDYSHIDNMSSNSFSTLNNDETIEIAEKSYNTGHKDAVESPKINVSARFPELNGNNTFKCHNQNRVCYHLRG